MKAFLDDDFLLDSKTAVDLYREVRAPAADRRLPLPPVAPAIADNHRSGRSPRSGWTGDHYKWRAMRAERRRRAQHHRRRRPTGRSSRPGRGPCPQTLRNPLYHWTHLELALRSASTASCSGPTPRREIYDLQRAARRAGRSPPRGCCRSSTCGRLQHGRSRRRSGAATSATPRTGPRHARLPDLASGQGARRARSAGVWNAWLDRLGAAANVSISTLADLRDALEQPPRLLPRGGLPRLGSRPRTDLRGAYTEREVEAIFAKRARGQALDARRDREVARRRCCYDFARDGSRARLGAAVPPGRDAQHQHAPMRATSAPTPATTPSATSPQARGAGPLPRPAGLEENAAPRRSSTTSTRATTSSSRQ